jgi:hypothetical protein
MKLKNREGTRVVILGDSPQDAKRAAILKKDGYTEVAEAPEPKVKGVTPSEFAGMTKTDLVAHLEAAGRDPKELKALKKEELVVLAQQAADAEAAKTDGEEETQP